MSNYQREHLQHAVENTKRRDEMRIRTSSMHGAFRVSLNKTLPICSKCNREILGQYLRINGVDSHFEGHCPN